MKRHSTCATVNALSDHLNVVQTSALRQFAKIYGSSVPQILFVSDACRNIREYENVLPNIVKVVRVKEHLRTHKGNDRYRTSPEYYRHLTDYEYEMPWQTDAWPFRDDLEWWEDLGYDYIAGPWLVPTASVAFSKGFKERCGGCDGFSLNKVESMLKAHEELVRRGYDPIRDTLPTDLIKSKIVPHKYQRTYELKCCPYYEQLRFCWNQPGWINTMPANVLMHLNFGMFPSAVHQPDENFRRSYCRYYRDPKTIVLLSSAIGNRDWWSIVRRECPYEEDRLVVAFNHCDALKSEVAKKAFGSIRRILTVHNDSSENYWSYAGIVEAWYALARSGFRGNRETMCIEWRPGGERSGCKVTYDGEITDARSTELVREIDGHGKSPTSGYMTYHIMRRKYPNAKIILIDFYGNSNGHSLNFRHEPTWEQQVYKSDPLVEMKYT